MCPHVLDRVEFRRVGRKPLGEDHSLGGLKEAGHQLAAVDRRTVPNDQQTRLEVALEVLDELHHLRTLDAAGVYPKEEALESHAPDDGKALPSKALVEQRGLATRRPGPHACGFGAQTALVDKDDDAALAAGLFFSVGQIRRFQFPMAFSSRSKARRSGLWQENPRVPSTRHTWPGW